MTMHAFQLPVGTEEMYGSFSPDRRSLLTGGDGHRPAVHIWALDDGRRVQTFAGHTQPVSAVAWTVDQHGVASGAFDGTARVWEVESGECVRVLGGHGHYVRSVQFSRAGEQLLTGDGVGVVRLWEVSSGRLLQEFCGHTDGVYHAVFDLGHTRILSGGRDGTIRLWSVDSGQCLRVISGPGAHVQCFDWHMDGRSFVSCAGDVRIWDSETGEGRTVFEGHEDTIRSVVFRRDGIRNQILSASHDRSVRIWDVESGRCLRKLSGLEQCGVNAVWSLDYQAVLGCDSSGGLREWSVEIS